MNTSLPASTPSMMEVALVISWLKSEKAVTADLPMIFRALTIDSTSCLALSLVCSVCTDIWARARLYVSPEIAPAAHNLLRLATSRAYRSVDVSTLLVTFCPSCMSRLCRRMPAASLSLSAAALVTARL